MARNIIVVNATQIVTSGTHPEGLFSVMPNFPRNFDSINYEGDIEATMKAAKSLYYDQLSKNYGNTNPDRVMATVTLETAGGVQIMGECVGKFPEITSTPEPEPEPVEEPTE